MLPRNIIIRRLTPEDSLQLKEAENLFQTTGAWGNLQNDTLKFFCESPTCAVFGAFDDARFVGCSVAGILGERHFDFYKMYGSSLATKLLPGQIAHIIGVILKDEYRGQGIGKELLKVRLKWAREVGAKFALSNSWVSKQHFNSARLFEAGGFQVVTRFTNFNPYGKTPCNFCGDSCRCENIVFLKEI
jgi:GNAT superfamily N-acetyltransferase